MTNKELAQKLLDLLGGKDNVLANAACMTRLRVTVKDTGNVDTEGIKALDGVMGLVEDDTMQIVLGPGKVNKVLEEFSKLTGLAKGVADESVVDAAATNKAAQKAKYESKPVQAFLKKISNVFVALLPGIIAAGLINGICNVINVSTAGALAGEWWYQGIRSMGWALFAYLPSWWAITRHVSLVAPLRWAASPARCASPTVPCPCLRLARLILPLPFCCRSPVRSTTPQRAA